MGCEVGGSEECMMQLLLACRHRDKGTGGGEGAVRCPSRVRRGADGMQCCCVVMSVDSRLHWGSALLWMQRAWVATSVRQLQDATALGL